MADIFIDVDGDTNSQVMRLLDLIFGNPDYPVPTVEEYGMQMAYVSSTRSPELGLKVGAAILSEDQAIIGVGVNTHPIVTGTPPFDWGTLAISELALETLQRLGSEILQKGFVDRLEKEPERLVAELLAGTLKRSGIRDLTEFQPTVHAEMAALLDALRAGTKVNDATAYVTAFPCHNCAKHLIALGIKVRYLEPYPKSKAAAMYGQVVAATFAPFTGIAPGRYQALFNVTEDRKNPDGTIKSWGKVDREHARPKVNLLVDQNGISRREAAALDKLKSNGSPVS